MQRITAKGKAIVRIKSSQYVENNCKIFRCVWHNHQNNMVTNDFSTWVIIDRRQLSSLAARASSCQLKNLISWVCWLLNGYWCSQFDNLTDGEYEINQCGTRTLKTVEFLSWKTRIDGTMNSGVGKQDGARD